MYASILVTGHLREVLKERGQDEVGIRLARVYDSAATMYAKAFFI